MPESHSLRGASVVVTGGCGFIGSHLVSRLVEMGARRIVVVDSLRYGDLANVGQHESIRIVKHTLGFDPREELEGALAGADYLFHLAAEKHNQSKDDPARVIRSNVEGTALLFQLAGAVGVKKIVFSSSLYAYGRLAGAPFVETELPEPRTVYGISKLTGEHLLAFFARQAGVDWNVLRYLFVYGPKQFAGMGYKSVIVKNFERILAGRPPTVYGDGEQTLDYVYVDDVVRATLAAIESPVTGEVLNIGSGAGTSVNVLIDTMLRVSGAPPEKVYADADWTAGSRRVGDVEKARRLLGFSATTSLEAGLRATYEWMKAQAGAPSGA